MFIGVGHNDYGTVVDMHICDDCGDPFTVCPALDEPESFGGGCLAEGCASYDESRDIDKVWDAVQPWIAEAGEGGVR